MKRTINNILEYIFDGFTDWYGLVDELGNEKANEVLKDNDAIAWIDNDPRDAIFGIAYINDAVTQITVLQSIDPEISILDISEQFKYVIDDVIFYPRDIMCDTRGLTFTITML